MSRFIMEGSLPEMGLRAGFVSPEQYGTFRPGPSMPLGITRGLTKPAISPELQKLIDKHGDIQRVDLTGDVSQILMHLGLNMQELQRAITTSTSGFPVRENLEAEAKILVPLETPVRNMLSRRPGSGLSSQWRQLTGLGGGFAAATTTTGVATATGAAVSIAVTSSANFSVGDLVYIDTGTNQEALPITAIADGTHISLLITVNHASGVAIVKATGEPGGGVGLIQTFFSETGAPATHTSNYQNQLAAYKLLGTFGSVSGFAMAAGATFQNQLAIEKRNALMNLMLNEENALINGNATSTAAPWGDGTNALSFNGLINLITTANGTPADQVQGSVGPLTTTQLDNQLRRLWRQGAIDKWMLMAGQEILSMTHLAEANGSIIRVQATTMGETVMGVKVTGYVDPITGELVKIIPSRFEPNGTIIFGCNRLPDGSPAADVEVLPQVQLPELAPDEQIQGYTVQEIAPAATSPQMYPFICTVFEVLRMKSSQHFGVSSGVTAV